MMTVMAQESQGTTTTATTTTGEAVSKSPSDGDSAHPSAIASGTKKQVIAVSKAQAKAADSPIGENKGMGLLLLDYEYPTQPGDIDDKRSFCTVNEKYECTDGFTLIPAMVKNLSFRDCQLDRWDDVIEPNFYSAMEFLMK